MHAWIYGLGKNRIICRSLRLFKVNQKGTYGTGNVMLENLSYEEKKGEEKTKGLTIKNVDWHSVDKHGIKLALDSKKRSRVSILRTLSTF